MIISSQKTNYLVTKIVSIKIDRLIAYIKLPFETKIFGNNEVLLPILFLGDEKSSLKVWIL